MNTKTNDTTHYRSPKTLTLSALLTAIGILLPIIMPAKIIIGPASFTLASHVPIFIAMFLSPAIAVTTALGTALGFFLSGFPIVIVFRALSHVIFATIGAWWLQKNHKSLSKLSSRWQLSVALNFIHAVAECIVVFLFAFLPQSDTSISLTTIFLLVGVGTLVHGMIDMEIATWIFQSIKRRK